MFDTTAPAMFIASVHSSVEITYYMYMYVESRGTALFCDRSNSVVLVCWFPCFLTSRFLTFICCFEASDCL